MILYFSGTGNSQHVALQLAEMLEDELVSINLHLKKGGKASFHTQKPLVFVAPTYAWRLPRVMEHWILNTDFTGNQNSYFVLTCGGSCGNAELYARRLCAKKGLRFYGLAPVLMPENYLAVFPTPSEPECREIIEQAAPHIAALGAQIQRSRPLPAQPVTLNSQWQSGPVNKLFYAFTVQDRGFRVSGSCTRCGKCAKRCVMNNIALVGGKPIWQGHCTHCMACIAGCPAGAIAYKTQSNNRHRHYIMEDALCWENGGEKA